MAEVPGFESMFLGNLHNTILRDAISVITRELGDYFPLTVSSSTTDSCFDRTVDASPLG
jgi:hypothetical protein